MASLLAAGVAALVVMFLPGFLAHRALLPGGPMVRAVAAAPLASLAVVFVLAQLTTLASTPFDERVFLATVVALAAAAVARLRGRRHGGDEGDPDEAGDLDEAGDDDAVRAPQLRLAALLLVVGVAIGGFVWVKAIRDVSVVPPNYDSSYHGFMVARIVDLHTVDPDEVLVADNQGTKNQAFYPLGMHATTALVAKLSSSPVADALTAVTVVSSVVVLPLGLLWLLLTLVPSLPLLAGLAAALAPAILMFPYGPVTWGGLPLVLATALVPAAIAELDRAVRRHLSVGDILLAGAGVTAIFVTHSSELPVVFLVVGAYVIARAVRKRSAAVIARAALTGVMVVASAAVMVATVVPSVGGGAAERVAIDYKPKAELAAAADGLSELRFGMPRGQPVLAMLAAAGLLVCLARRRTRPLGIVLLAFVGLYLLTAVKGPLSNALSFPWYHEAERIGYVLALFVPLLIAALLVEPVEAARSLAPRLSLRTAVAPVVAVVSLVPVAVAAQEASDPVAASVRSAYMAYSPVQASELAAFDYLAANVPPGRTVLTDVNSDGSIWMYAFHGVEPVFFLPPGTAPVGSTWDNRLYLVDHLGELGSNPRVRSLLEEWRVSYVYFDESGFVEAPRRLSLEKLRTFPHLVEVFTSGHAHVFRIEM